jgi:hypothetical protein
MLRVECPRLETEQEAIAMEGLEVLATSPTLWGDRIQRGFVGNRLERDILTRAYELIAPQRRSSCQRQGRATVCEIVSAEGGVAQFSLAIDASADAKGGRS